MCFRQLPARPAMTTSNAFAALMPEDPDDLDSADDGRDHAGGSVGAHCFESEIQLDHSIQRAAQVLWAYNEAMPP